MSTNKASANDSPVPGYSASNWPTGGCAGGSQGRCTMARSAEKTYTMMRVPDTKTGTRVETKDVFGGIGVETREKTIRGHIVQKCTILATPDGIAQFCTPRDRTELFRPAQTDQARRMLTRESGQMPVGDAFFVSKDETSARMGCIGYTHNPWIVLKAIGEIGKEAHLVGWCYDKEPGLYRPIDVLPNPNPSPFAPMAASELYATEENTRSQQIQSVVTRANTIDFALVRALSMDEQVVTNQHNGRLATEFHKAANVMHRSTDSPSPDQKASLELENDMLIGLA